MFVVFDLDGTLADIDHRLHLVKGEKQDWDLFYERCVDDRPIRPAIVLCRTLFRSHRVEIWSGRNDVVREQTEIWLEAHSVPYDGLRMRPAATPYVKDVELKESWLLSSSWQPDVIFEDRQRIVDMWRRNGVFCCQVAGGDY